MIHMLKPWKRQTYSLTYVKFPLILSLLSVTFTTDIVPINTASITANIMCYANHIFQSYGHELMKISRRRSRTPTRLYVLILELHKGTPPLVLLQVLRVGHRVQAAEGHGRKVHDRILFHLFERDAMSVDLHMCSKKNHWIKTQVVRNPAYILAGRSSSGTESSRTPPHRSAQLPTPWRSDTRSATRTADIGHSS